MVFESGHIYHIYNQGNNRQKIFFTRDNYLFFLKKIKRHIIPFADVLAWCLMPNHFHFFVYVGDGVSDSSNIAEKQQLTFNSSIGIMLRSYTRAVNLQEGRSGSLFREGTKAICVTQPQANPPLWFKSEGKTVFLSSDNETRYPNNCFNYIIKNPLKDGLVKKLSKWEFTSYHELMGKEDIINKKRIEEFGLCLL